MGFKKNKSMVVLSIAGMLSLSSIMPTTSVASSVSSKPTIDRYLQKARADHDKKYPKVESSQQNPRPTNKTRKSKVKEAVSTQKPKNNPNSSRGSSTSKKVEGKRAEKRDKFVPGEVIVKFKANASSDVVKKKYNLKTKKKLKGKGAEVLKLEEGQSVETLVSALSKDSSVEVAQPNFKYYPDSVPNDPYYEKLWGLNNHGQLIAGQQGTADIDINAPEAWSKTKKGQEVVVGVIDTGVDINHPDLQGKIWENKGEIPGNGIDDDHNGYVDDIDGWDFYNEDATVYDKYDGDEHGTHVSGTITANTNNQTGVSGIAQNVKIMPLKFLGPNGGSTEDAIEAIEYAKSMGVKITNNSWGGGDYDILLKRAIDESGSLFVAAAGNDGVNNDVYAHYPSSYESKNILSVAAVDNQGSLAGFSNYGQNSVDVAAPGVNILSTVPKKPLMGASAEINGLNYKAVYNGFGFENIIGSNEQVDAIKKALDYLGINEQSNILLVQDDESVNGGLPSYLSTYKTMLDTLGYQYTVQTVAANAVGPDKETLQSYDATIWFTGRGFGSNSASGTLTNTDVSSLNEYLIQGGKLLLTGQDALWLQENSSFVTDTLDLTILGEGLARNVKGTIGTAYDGSAYNIEYSNVPYADFIYPFSEENSKSTIDLMYPAEEDYSKAYEFFNGTSMATPHVTGIAALMLGEDQTLQPQSIIQTLKNTGKPLSALEGATDSGKLVDAASALDKLSNDDDIPGIKLQDSVVTDSLDAETDKDDVYSIFLDRGEELNVKMEGANGTDYDLYVFSPYATTINNNSNMMAYSENQNTSNEQLKFVAPEAGVYYIDAYAYAGKGAYTLTFGNGEGEYEDTSRALNYSGYWNTINTSTASNGTVQSLNSNGGVTFKFTGNEIEWVGFKDSYQGLAAVYIDDVKEDRDISLYSASPMYKTTIFKKRLDKGQHTIRIEWLGKADPKNKKSRSAINVDKFIVRDIVTPPSAPQGVVTYYNEDEKAPTIEWYNSLTAISYNVLRKESTQTKYTQINSAPVNGTIFTDKTAVKGKTYDYVVIAVGPKNTPSDLSQSFSYTYDDEVPGLPMNNLKATGTLDTNTFDIVDVWNVPLTAGKMYEIKLEGLSLNQADFDLHLFDKNTTSIYNNDSLSSSVLENTSAEKIVFQPATSGVYYIVPAAYSGSGKYNLTVTQLNAQKVEENSSAIKYDVASEWRAVSDTKASGKQYKTNSVTNSSATFTFNGKGIRLYGMKSAVGGTGDIYIDNKLVGNVDFYSQTPLYQQVIFENFDLIKGSHTIKIVNTSQHTNNNTATSINVDAFDVIN